MSQTATHLEDHAIAERAGVAMGAAAPIPLRVLLAAQPELVTPVLQVVQRVVARHLLDSVQLKADEGHGSAVTLIQRFGSAANLMEYPPLCKSLILLEQVCLFGRRLPCQHQPAGALQVPDDARHRFGVEVHALDLQWSVGCDLLHRK